MRDEFELAEVLWEVAEPSLSNADRDEMCVALHGAGALEVVAAAVRFLTRDGIALPCNVFADFHAWLRTQPALDDDDPRFPIRLSLYLAAADVRSAAESARDVGGYGEETLCYFILDDAGVVDATHDRQADALRRWLADNRPSPALRADFWAVGFGYLLEDPGTR
jgi:hypothetical protein